MTVNEPDEPTRRVTPSDGPGPDRNDDPTAVLGSVSPETGEGDPANSPSAEDEVPPRNRLREIVIGLGGAVLGFALAFVIVALSTSGADELSDDGAVAELEDAQATIAERDARVAELEAELAEAEAAAGDRDEDLVAQREALEDRSAALDQREQVLDEREAAIADREAEVAAREEAVEQAEQDRESDGSGDGDAGDGGTPDGGGDGIIDLPDVDEEEVSNAIERLLDRIRGLFGE